MSREKSGKRWICVWIWSNWIVKELKNKICLLFLFVFCMGYLEFFIFLFSEFFGYRILQVQTFLLLLWNIVCSNVSVSYSMFLFTHMQSFPTMYHDRLYSHLFSLAHKYVSTTKLAISHIPSAQWNWLWWFCCLFIMELGNSHWIFLIIILLATLSVSLFTFWEINQRYFKVYIW